MTSKSKVMATGLVGVLALSTLVACSNDSGAPNSKPDASGANPGSTQITLRVAIDQGLDEGAIAAFEERAAQFEAENSGILIEAQEYNWTGETFAAQLSGGTLPVVFTIPFTDGRGLIERGQIADISDLVAELPYADQFNPNVAAAGLSADGDMWAIPIAAYGQGLHYNRQLFVDAGLDPDKPPATWDEVRSAAKAIADATGQAGYAMMTQGNTGGWILTSMVYAFGGNVQEQVGDDVVATIDTPVMREVLEYLHDLRWEDNSMGANFLYDWGSINQDFAAGKIGMYVSGGGNYGNLFTQNAMNPDEYGLSVLPLTGDNPGALGGGTLAVVSAKATEAEKAAAVKWIDFYYMRKLADKEAAILDAQTTFDQGMPVGAPQLPIFDEQTYQQQQEWIAHLVNVPLDQMTPYTDHVGSQALIPEPPVATQQTYAILDVVLQSVLTQRDANIDTLLQNAQKEVEALLANN